MRVLRRPLACRQRLCARRTTLNSYGRNGLQKQQAAQKQAQMTQMQQVAGEEMMKRRLPMADNLMTNPGVGGAVIATDEIAMAYITRSARSPLAISTPRRWSARPILCRSSVRSSRQRTRRAHQETSVSWCLHSAETRTHLPLIQMGIILLSRPNGQAG